MRTIRLFIILLIVLAVVGLIVFLVITKTDFTHKIISNTKEVSTTIIEEALPVSKFVTLEHNYNTVGKYNKNDEDIFFNILRVQRNNRLVYSFDGKVSLGFNGALIKVLKTGENIEIIMPPVEIISDEINLSNVKFYVNEKSFFAKNLTPEQINSIVQAKRQEIVGKVLYDEKLIKQAQESASQNLLNLLAQIPNIDTGTIIFTWDSSTKTFLLETANNEINNF